MTCRKACLIGFRINGVRMVANFLCSRVNGVSGEEKTYLFFGRVERVKGQRICFHDSVYRAGNLTRVFLRRVGHCLRCVFISMAVTRETAVPVFTGGFRKAWGVRRADDNVGRVVFTVSRASKQMSFFRRCWSFFSS